MRREDCILFSGGDDLDPSLEATDTIRFAFDKTEYEIDLSDKHSNELRSTLDKYIQHARRVGGRRGSAPASRQSPGRRSDLPQVRIAGGVLAAYDTKDVKALRAATGTPEPSARPARRSRAKVGAVTAKAK